MKKHEKVMMKNHNSAKVLGKETITIQFTYGHKLILVNVFYIPNIRKNLVSTSLLCKKDFKIILEFDKIIVF